jgi:PKD repeat protein
MVMLDGSDSYDPDGDTLIYQWEFLKAPKASALTHTSPSNPTGSVSGFTPDSAGTYILKLTVRDREYEDSDTVTVLAASSNAAPIAHAGPDQSVIPGEMVNLDGSLSYDPDSDPLMYTWSLQTKPDDSVLTDTDITDRNTQTPSFTPDADGTYIFKLVVSDKGSAGKPAYVRIHAAPPDIPLAKKAGHVRQ